MACLACRHASPSAVVGNVSGGAPHPRGREQRGDEEARADEGKQRARASAAESERVGVAVGDVVEREVGWLQTTVQRTH